MSEELEALNYLVNLAGNKVKYREEIFNSEATILKAIRRNEPMKIVFIRVTNALTENFWDEPTCPKCKAFVIDGDKFCHECGQALDWSDKK